MKVVILGAGASYGASRNAGWPAPLVTGILATARRCGILAPSFADGSNRRTAEILASHGKTIEEFRRVAHMPPEGEHLQVLTSFVEEQLKVSADQYETVPIDFERVFSLVDAELLGLHGLLKLQGTVPRGPSPADVLEMQFKLVLCGSIIAATRDLTCDHHDRLATWLEPGDLVVSFNYDLLMDRALRRHAPWYLDDGYAIRFGKVGTRAADGVRWRDVKNTKSKVLLLKPHGSLNWLYPRDSWETVFHASLLGKTVRQPKPLVYCLDDIHPRFEEDHPVYEWWERYDHEEGGYTYDMHALLVPPTLVKPYRDFEPLIGRLWAVFLHSLLNVASEVYVIGYSLRPDDHRSAWLVRKVATESLTLKRIVVVDPSDDVFSRAQQMFGPKPVERGPRTLADFAATL